MPERRISKDIRQQLHGYFVAQYESYRDAVLRGTKLASRKELRKVRRQEEDLKSITQWTFDEKRATAPLIWMAANLRFPSGDKKGKPLKLESWQVWDIMVLFGWVDAKGNRRYNDCYIEVPRKNGKSTYAGAVLDYLAFASGEMNGNPCFIGATSLDQAGECFERAGDELAGTDAKVFNSKNNKVITWNGGRIIALASEPKDGKLPHGAIIDEYHQHKSNDLIDSITSGNVSDPNVLVMRITTAGTKLNGVCKQEHDKCIKILEGSIPMDKYFVAIYTIDDEDSPDDPSCWPKANPNYGVSVDAEMLMGRYNYSRGSAADMITFKTKNLNVWVHSLKRWANMENWLTRCCEPVDWESLKGRICYGGLDLSHNSDFTAFTLDFPFDDGKHIQRSWFFIPGDKVIELERTLKVPLEQWVADGYIIATPGAVIDYAVVAATIEEARSIYDIQMVAADRWHLNILDQHMPSWWAELACEFSQGWKMMSSATSGFERAYLLGNIQSGGNPVLKWMMSCAESKSDINGNVKIVKPDVSRSEARIDGVITSIMAYDTAASQQGQQFDAENLDSLIRIF